MGGEAGKGDTYRPVNRQKWSDNYEKIFGKRDEMDFQKDKQNKKCSKINKEKT